jgi:hypothetical protein
MYLTVHDWRKGKRYWTARLSPGSPRDGVVRFDADVLSKEDTPTIIVEADVWVQGRRVSVPVHVNGSFVVRNVKGEGLYIEPEGCPLGFDGHCLRPCFT